jgi:hypothetical protein
MQPPLPRKPVPHVTIEKALHRHASPSTHHPLEPADTAMESADGGAAPLVGTQDSRLLRAWAEYHGAEPATGQATASGPATVVVNDQGSGLRFNFPGTSKFRALTWEEWLGHFVGADLVFVFEIAPPVGQSGARFGGAFYHILSSADWGGKPLAHVAEADEVHAQSGDE